MTVWRRTSCLVLAGVVSVAGFARGEAPRPKWAVWMERVVPGLPKVAVPPPAPAEWVTIRTPDTLPLRLGPEYRVRNKFGCWVKNEDRWPGPGWRDVCVYRSDPMLLSGYHMRPGPLDPKMEDQHRSEAWRAETFSIGGRRVVVERALVSGGMEGARRERRLVAHIEVGEGEQAILSGRTGDDGGYEELLMIAATVGPPQLATESQVVARAEAYVARKGVNVLPRACGVVRKVREGITWGWHVVFCYDPRKVESGQGANRVVQVDVVRPDDVFIPDPTPGNTSTATLGIKRLPGMDDFERLRASQKDARSSDNR